MHSAHRFAELVRAFAVWAAFYAVVVLRLNDRVRVLPCLLALVAVSRVVAGAALAAVVAHLRVSVEVRHTSPPAQEWPSRVLRERGRGDARRPLSSAGDGPQPHTTRKGPAPASD